jgi:hypothetical protein
MAAEHADPFAKFKAAQREAWASFLPVEVITTIPAAKLVSLPKWSPGKMCSTLPVAPESSR